MRMSNVNISARLNALNLLINENKIKASMNKNKIYYEIVVEEKSPDDIVFEVIKEAEKNGIWIRDIRFKTKLSQIILNKALKSLENKKLIRSIKTISNRKLYILYDLQPDDTITGGACYDSGYIREDIVKNLKSACFQYLYDLYKNSYDQVMANLHELNDEVDFGEVFASAANVQKSFKDRKLFQEIKLEDIENILNILYYECKLLKKKMGNTNLFRYNPYNKDQSDFLYAPCMTCHLYKDCKPESVGISPQNCKYIHYEHF